MRLVRTVGYCRIMPTLSWATVLATAALASCATPPAGPAAPGDRILAGTVMVALPGGAFEMGQAAGGGADERPVHRVHIPPFRLAETEVTVGQYRLFVEATGFQTDAERNAAGKPGCAVLDVGLASPTYRAGTSWRSPGFEQSEQHPVVCLSYADVQAFVEWLNAATGQAFRLPTESEWEYAARAGSADDFPWGINANDGCAFANGADETPDALGHTWPLRLDCRDGFAHAAPVGSFRPNAFGLRDMIGNAWEWTADCYHGNYAGAPTDGRAWVEPGCAKRSIRGGGWPYPASFLRSANRGGSSATLRANDRGFRLAL